jgi:NAD(P)-dependent dehydrogenase (short-subunit alcohol dehydrogenase family)
VTKSERSRHFRDAVVLVTGSSRGLGFALSREFGRRGADLVLCARNEGPLKQAVEELEAMGARALGVPCDIGDRGAVDDLVAQATARFGRVDVLVNNAGIITVGPISTQTVEDFDDAMRAMFWGILYPTLALLPQMRERGKGSIVNITSIGGKISFPHLLPYNSAKFAAVGFSEGLRAELARYGIRVTTVVPGFMRTGSHLNAGYKGNYRREFAWFSMGAGLPVMAMTAERAASRIVDATARGTAELQLTLKAKLAARMTGLFPGLTANVLGIVNRVLPDDPGGPTDLRTGKESQTAFTAIVNSASRKAARDLHQEGHHPAGGTD